MTEDEMVGWHHQPNRHEFEEAPVVGDAQGGLACCKPWGRKESDMTKELNNKPNSRGLILPRSPIFKLLSTFFG